MGTWQRDRQPQVFRLIVKAAAALSYMAIAIGAVIVTGPALAAHGPTFAGSYFSPTNGRVGYHMIANNHFAQDPCSQTAGLLVKNISVSGTAPPGLTVPNSETPWFEGTPRQAGDWMVIVTWHGLQCSDSGTDYGDVTTKVNFHIDP